MNLIGVGRYKTGQRWEKKEEKKERRRRIRSKEKAEEEEEEREEENHTQGLQASRIWKEWSGGVQENTYIDINLSFLRYKNWTR